MTATVEPSALHRTAGPTSDAGRAALAAGTSPALADVLQPLSLRRNFSWIVAGNTVCAASLWAVVVLLARLGDLEMLGRVMFAFAVCAPVSALAKLGLNGVLVTDAKRQYTFADYLALRLITTALAFLAIAGILAATAPERPLVLLILAIALGDAFESLSDLLHGLMQQHERMNRVGIALMIRGPLKLVVLAAGVLATGSAFWGIAGMALVSALTCFAWDFPGGLRIWRASLHAAGPTAPRPSARLGPRWHLPTLLSLAWTALPLGVVTAMLTLFPNVPRYMVSHYLGDHGLGIFVPVAALGMLGKMVATGIGQSSSPRLAKYHAAGNSAAFYLLVGKLLVVTACLGTGLVGLVAIAGGPILSLLYGGQFAQYAPLALYLTVASGLLYLSNPLAKAVQATRHFKVHMLIRITSILILLALLPGRIEAHGLNGAAAVMVLASAFLVLAYGSAILLIVWPSHRNAAPKCPQPSL